MINILNYIAEAYLTFGVIILLFLNFFLRNKRNQNHVHITNNTVAISSLIILCITLLILFICDFNQLSSVDNLLISTAGANVLKKLIVFFSILSLAPIVQGFNLQKLSYFEFYPLYLLAVLTSLLLVNAADFLSVYLLIEIQSLCFYILATFRKDSVFSIKAGLKYFIFGSLASCILLFALSFLYGALGTLNFYKIHLLLFSFPLSEQFTELNTLIVFSLFLICLVLLFKLGIAPFHFWVPDVYEGSPISTTIILSTLPKLAMFDLFIRLSKVFGEAFKELELLFIVTGVLSIIIGSVCAIFQKRLKRFLIYSSISQMGFPIILLSTNNVESVSFIYFFIIFYTFSSVLTWIAYTIFYKFSGKGYLKTDFLGSKVPLFLSDLSNLASLDTNLSYFFTIIFFSAAGIPPLPGFLAKFSVVLELIKSNSVASGIVLLFVTVISTYYYVKLIKIIYFEVSDVKFTRFTYLNEEFDTLLKINYFAAFFCLFMLVHSFFFFDSWLILSQYIYFNTFLA